MMKSEFLNPYNFVKLPKSKRTKYNDSDKHTGVIEYSITTKTPLFIRIQVLKLLFYKVINVLIQRIYTNLMIFIHILC